MFPFGTRHACSLTSTRLDTWRARQKEHSSHLAFPDEIDTPLDIPARQRFARYRGLKSMKTSPWDPDENLPRDYAKIFKVGEREWDAVGRRLSGGIEDGVEVSIEFFANPSGLLTFAP
jgi:pre-rRNA-processing protein TSR1